MADPKFKLDRAGGAEVLKELAAAHVNELARQIAAAAGADAEVETYSTDRAAASVGVPAHRQATDGVLSRAAAAAGVEVRLK
ncbi:hypothetical protein [Tsukamurella sp. 1534]|uniref:hypothetical protein n=1 Tax=Tsukamurella sp. 1534 TaxID=1151061 RepID=UPI0002EFF452|nr:hypothetical protein [Tsukamurella sp. 1534]